MHCSFRTPERAAFIRFFDWDDVARKNRQAAIGTFFLHLIPGGAAADQVSQGEYGEAAISAAGDLFLVAGAATKAVKAVKAAKVVTVAGMAVEGGIAAYRGYQGIEKLTRGDTIGAAGDAGEVVLRLIGVKLSASELKAMKKIVPSTLRQTGTGYFSGSADEAYDTIRKSTTDVEAIAQNTGIKPANIQKVKDHIFNEEHLLDRYVDLGIPAEMRRFDSDIGIANAWKRLEQGNFTPEDIQLLRHETAESSLMRRWSDPSYNRAHNRAQEKFPAPILD